MQFRSLSIIVACFLAINVSAQDVDFREIENNAFEKGEKLTFDVRYGPITAGIAEMHIPRTLKIFGRDVYQITFRVNSVPAFDPFFKVRDRYETYLDVKGVFPWRFEQHIREGGYKRDFSAFFDQINGKAKTAKGEYDIPRYTNDIVSALYYVRTLDVQNYNKGDVIHLENFYKDKVYPLDVIYRGTERVTVDAGTFDCFILEPLVVEGGLFKSEGSIMIWMTDDELKIPVKVKTKVVIGSINAELTKYEGLAGEFGSKVEK
jgi:hypothetical protein